MALSKSHLGISISLSISISSSIYFPLIRSLGWANFEDNALGFRLEIIVKIVGLAVKTCTVPTGGILTGILTEYKTDVFAKLPKTKILASEVLTEVFATEALTRVCTPEVAKIEESNTILTFKELKIMEHFDPLCWSSFW